MGRAMIHSKSPYPASQDTMTVAYSPPYRQRNQPADTDMFPFKETKGGRSGKMAGTVLAFSVLIPEKRG